MMASKEYPKECRIGRDDGECERDERNEGE